MHGRFTPYVMSASGGLGREYKHFNSRLSEKIAREKIAGHYSVVPTWVRRKIVFSLIISIIFCIRGSGAVANNEKIMISSSESIITSELLSEMHI